MWGCLATVGSNHFLQDGKRTVLVCYRVVDAELQKTGIECEIGSLIPVTGERQLLAQSDSSRIRAFDDKAEVRKLGLITQKRIFDDDASSVSLTTYAASGNLKDALLRYVGAAAATDLPTVRGW